MKKKAIYTLMTIAIAVCAFFIGTTQAKTITKTETKTVEVVPDGYIDSTTKEFHDDYIDLRTVNEYSETENGLNLYTTNGDCYSLSPEKITTTKTDYVQVYFTETEEDLDNLFFALEDRDGKIIIEVINGTVIDDEGNGEDSLGYYIAYDAEQFSKGDRVQSILVYNPATNYADDILYRVDTLIK